MAARQKSSSTFDLSWKMVTGIYVLIFIITLIIYRVVSWVGKAWGGVSYFSLHDLWQTNGTVIDGLGKVWFIFAWGIAVTLLAAVISSRKPRDYSRGYIFGFGAWVSLHAGIFEELMYRWLRFSIAMVILPLTNFILFGFIPGNEGLVHWVYESLLIPVANWSTFGALHEYLYDPRSWVIGAAIISANGKFREDHEANGLFSQVNAWFLGMVFFYLTFHYGLFTAIVAHVLYDMAIFTVAAITSPKRTTYYRARSSYDYRR
ncbi:MAG: hypothetical protein ACOH18_03685 [Candidatus Saccharimonadaceae bacterium]